MEQTVYLKLNKSVCVDSPVVYVKDIAGVYSSDKHVTARIKAIKVLHARDGSDRRYVVSVLKVIECILKEFPSVAVESEGEQEEAEGCLAIPGKYGITHRPKKVVVLAENRHGETVEYMGEDLLARAFCHEIDHLDGKLFTDCVVRMLDEE